MILKEEIVKKIEEILKRLGVENPKVNLDYPTHIEKGDLSTNVAMMYAKEVGRKPLELAEVIRDELESGNLASVMKVDAVSHGFLNFFFDRNYFNENVKQILEKDEDFGRNVSLNENKIFIEHTQPNPFKEFHIGHLMNNAIGESVARIVKANGAEVQIATYHGDVGLHVAKAIWAVRKIRQGFGGGAAYTYGSKSYEEAKEGSDIRNEILEINKKIYDQSDSVINKIYEEGRQESIEYFEKLYKKLGSQFDYHFFESESGEVGKDLVSENIGKVFEKGDEGAVIFRGENFEPKTHTRVFLNKEGLPTYEAKELGLAQMKKDLFDYHKSITITANEQDSFFKVVEVAIGEVFPELKGKLTHLSHGLLKLPTGKMSSREGNVISAEDMINQVKTKIKERIDDDKIAEEIAIGAIKYSILRQAIGGDIIFDFDKSISFEGDSGPYLQYSAVRANSLLQKSVGQIVSSHDLPEGWETINLERYLERFPSVVEKAGREYAPHHIATYLIELAGEFNSFYASHKIIDSEDPTSPYRLGLTKAFDEVMTKGLDLLGIKVPERM